MAISLVQHRAVYYSAATGNLTFSSNVTAGSLLVCCVSSYGALEGLQLVSDNLNGNWTRIFWTTGGDGSLQLSMWYKYNSAGGTCTVTVKSLSSGTAYVSFNINEFSGALTTDPIDGFDTNVATSTAVSGGPVDPTVTNDLLIGNMTSMASSAVTIAKDADYTQIDEYENGATAIHMNVQYRIYAADTADTANWTLGSSLGNIGGLAAFKAGAAVVSAVLPFRTLLGVGK